jgi:hypothetical protein
MKTGQSYQYTRRVGEALAAYRPWLYEGQEGALRLAREYGAGLADGPDAKARELMNNGVSYYEICVKGYGLKPPLSVKEWQEEVRRSYESVLDDVFEGGKRDEMPVRTKDEASSTPFRHMGTSLVGM